MSDELQLAKTKTGNLDFHLAAAACYVPLMMINYVAPFVFLLTEPKEHTLVRFHAVQSLLVSAVWILSVIVTMALSVAVPVFFIVMGSVLGMEDLLGLIGVGLQLICSLLTLLVTFGGLIGLVALTVLAASQKNPRVPVLAGFADRFAGAADA